ncbi:MAG: hypothetical protein KGH64_01935 [Candidatus Micrarchaeota archaeon]|nr:hypothetical protein [Candidatus Micrarchaeota archaeon]
MKQLLQSIEYLVNLPFARELWAYRLSDHIAKIDVPMLIVIGKKDIQIDWKIDGKALQNATAQKIKFHTSIRRMPIMY